MVTKRLPTFYQNYNISLVWGFWGFAKMLKNRWGPPPPPHALLVHNSSKQAGWTSWLNYSTHGHTVHPNTTESTEYTEQHSNQGLIQGISASVSRMLPLIFHEKLKVSIWLKYQNTFCFIRSTKNLSALVQQIKCPVWFISTLPRVR